MVRWWQVERVVYFDRTALSAITEKLSYPIGAITDVTARHAACTALWGEIQKAFSTIGDRTMTQVVFDEVLRSEALQDALALVRRSASLPATPAKPGPSGIDPEANTETVGEKRKARNPLSNHGAVPRGLGVGGSHWHGRMAPEIPCPTRAKMRTVPAQREGAAWPRGVCFWWAKEGKCWSFGDKSKPKCDRFTHQQEHKGKFPQAAKADTK